MGRQAEVFLSASKEWRDEANAAMKKRGRGAQKACAKAIGCSEGTVSQVLSGHTAFSERVGPISDWLGIDRPASIILDGAEAELLELYRNASDKERDLLRNMVKMMLKGRTEV